MNENIESQIESLSKELALTEMEAGKLKEEFERKVDKKRAIESKILELKLKSKGLKNAKNELSLKISSLRSEAENLKVELSSKFEEIRVFKKQIFNLKKFTSKPAEEVKREIESLEWTLQTERYNPVKEKNLIARVKSLEEEAKIHEKMDELTHKISNSKDGITVLKQKLTCLGSEISKLKDLRRRKIEELNMVYNEILKLKMAREELVKEIGEVKARMENVYGEIGKLKSKLKNLQEELLLKKLEKSISNVEKTVKNAEEKFRKGEKLSFEEFKLLLGRGKIRFKGED